MPFQFQQSTGQMRDPNGNLMATGYSGHGSGVNDPRMQFVPNEGPICQGIYTIGSPHTPVDHLGPLAMPLYPAPSNVMHGRFGFFCHGDNGLGNKSASNGCIVMDHNTRVAINNSSDKILIVIA